jgi:BNR/Asp-box repeat
MAFHPDLSDYEFVGTEPAAIFVSHNGALSWRECPEVAQLRDEHGWLLPYSPKAGCVRGFTFHGKRAYAAVEVGGALRSDDGGQTWRLAEGSDGNPDLQGPPEPLIYPDVHSIAAHPSAPDLVFAPTGGGLFMTRDGGKTWRLLYACYARAVWLDGDDANHLIVGPADGVDSHGRIEESHDGGKTWQVTSDGLHVPWRRHMVERFEQVGDELFAVLSNGELLVAPLASLQWKRVLRELDGVHAVTSMKQ